MWCSWSLFSFLLRYITFFTIDSLTAYDANLIVVLWCAVYVASDLAHCTVIYSGVMQRQVRMPGQSLQIDMKLNVAMEKSDNKGYA